MEDLEYSLYWTCPKIQIFYYLGQFRCMKVESVDSAINSNASEVTRAKVHGMEVQFR